MTTELSNTVGIMTALKNKGYIYKVTNIITGQFYIGQRSKYIGEPEDDLGVHYFTSSKYVKPLFRNNTSEWKKEILYRDIQYAETLNDMEGYAIHKEIKDSLCMNRYDPTIHPGFSTAGTHHSAETLAKISEANRGKHPSDETRAKISEAAKHRAPMSAETRTKIGAASRDRYRSEETRAKMREAMRWHSVSSETRAKLSATLRGHKVSEETRMKLSDALRGKHRAPMSEETRAKIGASQRARLKC